MNIESSASEHCFHKNGTDKSLYVFEAPIDLLSHITLYPYGWQEHSYVACCGTSIQPVLERLRQIQSWTRCTSASTTMTRAMTPATA